MMSAANGVRFYMIARPMVFMRGLLSRARRIVVPDRRVRRKDNSSSSAGTVFGYTEGDSSPGGGSARLALPGLPARAEGGTKIPPQRKEVPAPPPPPRPAVNKGGGHGEVTKVIAFLELYVENHFRMEETYMKRFHYPEYPRHKIEHTTYSGDFYYLRQELDNDGVTPH